MCQYRQTTTATGRQTWRYLETGCGLFSSRAAGHKRWVGERLEIHRSIDKQMGNHRAWDIRSAVENFAFE